MLERRNRSRGSERKYDKNLSKQSHATNYQILFGSDIRTNADKEIDRNERNRFINSLWGYRMKFWGRRRYHNQRNIYSSANYQNRETSWKKICFIFVFVSILIFPNIITSRTSKRPKQSEQEIPIILLGLLHNNQKSTFPLRLPAKSAHSTDYGGLKLTFLQDGQSRSIRPDPDALLGHIYTKNDIGRKDHVDPYYAYDDDFVRAQPFRKQNLECRRTSWHKMHNPNCNLMHETLIEKEPGTNKKLGYVKRAALMIVYNFLCVDILNGTKKHFIHAFN